MSALTPRRSTRASNAATRKYTNDAFKASGLALSASSGDSSTGESSAEESSDGKRPGDEDFTIEPADEDDDVGNEFDADALGYNYDSNSDPDASISEVLSDSDVDSSSVPTSRRKDTATPRGHAKELQHSTRTRYRDACYEDVIGDDPKDIAAYKATKLKFWDDVTVPHRSYEQNTRAGLTKLCILSHDEIQTRIRQERDWYCSRGGCEIFNHNQDVRSISRGEAGAYTSQFTFARNVVIGPYPQQRNVTVAALDSLNIDTAFLSSQETKANSEIKSSGRGWLLNLGRGVHTLAWIPGHNGVVQYLSASTWVQEATPSRKENVSAFNSWPTVSSALQIWSFGASESQERPARLEQSIRPSLVAVICFDWGIIKSFGWCPFSLVTHTGQQTKSSLGLLATVHGDGGVRVLNVSLPSTLDTLPQYLKAQSFAFTSIPSDTVFTCLCWLSTKLLAAGCANGYVAVWDIEQHIFGKDRPLTARPIFYEPLHDVYVTQIKSCGPYLSQFLLTTGQDGQVRLCDIRDPLADVAYAARHRLGPSVIDWHPHLNNALIGDEVLVGVSIRKFSTSSTVIVHLSSPTTSIATSTIHSSILIGCYDGSVMISNPVRRCASGRQRVDSYMQYLVKHEWREPRKDEVNGPKRLKFESAAKLKATPASKTALQVSETTQQKHDDVAGDAFHESQPHNPATQLGAGVHQIHGNSTGANPSDQQDFSSNLLEVAPGLTRLLIGFPVRHVKTVNPLIPSSTVATSKRKAHAHKDPKKESTNNPATIFEEPSGVTSVVWHPNIICGGWAAVGWADGLVLVSDLCWE